MTITNPHSDTAQWILGRIHNHLSGTIFFVMYPTTEHPLCWFSGDLRPQLSLAKTDAIGQVIHRLALSFKGWWRTHILSIYRNTHDFCLKWLRQERKEGDPVVQKLHFLRVSLGGCRMWSCTGERGREPRVCIHKCALSCSSTPSCTHVYVQRVLNMFVRCPLCWLTF